MKFLQLFVFLSALLCIVALQLVFLLYILVNFPKSFMFVTDSPIGIQDQHDISESLGFVSLVTQVKKDAYLLSTTL